MTKMGNYIDRAALFNSLTNAKTIAEVFAAIQDAPAADVEKVVLCKDCKWFDDIGCAIRIVDDSDRPSENDFCSFAERKEKTMDDLISRQAAIEALVKGTHLTWEHLKIIYPMLNVFENLPSAERHGRWRKERVSSTGSGSYGVYQCSICGAMFPDIGYGYNYCPNCGAKMGEVPE